MSFKLDLSRKPNPHTSFGGGIEFWLGFQLTKIEGEIMFTKRLERFPNIELAVGLDDNARLERFGLRSMSELPVTLGAPS